MVSKTPRFMNTTYFTPAISFKVYKAFHQGLPQLNVAVPEEIAFDQNRNLLARFCGDPGSGFFNRVMWNSSPFLQHLPHNPG